MLCNLSRNQRTYTRRKKNSEKKDIQAGWNIHNIYLQFKPQFQILGKISMRLADAFKEDNNWLS